MAKWQKLLIAICNNPNAVRFEEACHAAELLGFVQVGGKGSHRTYGKAYEPVLLNFQNRNGYIPTYQARQLIDMIDKHGGADAKISH